MGRTVISEKDIPEFVEKRHLTEEEEKEIKSDEEFYRVAEERKRIARADFFDTPERMLDRISGGLNLYKNVVDLSSTEAQDVDGKYVTIPPGVEMVALGLLKQTERIEAILRVFEKRNAPVIVDKCNEILSMLGKIRISAIERRAVDVSPLMPLIASLRQTIVDFWEEEDRLLHRES